MKKKRKPLPEPVTAEAARDLARAFNQRMVVILTCDQETFTSTTYGFDDELARFAANYGERCVKLMNLRVALECSGGDLPFAAWLDTIKQALTDSMGKAGA